MDPEGVGPHAHGDVADHAPRVVPSSPDQRADQTPRIIGAVVEVDAIRFAIGAGVGEARTPPEIDDPVDVPIVLHHHAEQAVELDVAPADPQQVDAGLGDDPERLIDVER